MKDWKKFGLYSVSQVKQLRDRLVTAGVDLKRVWTLDYEKELLRDYSLDGPRLPLISPQCTICQHYHSVSLEERNEKSGVTWRVCRAFPDGIPIEIWIGSFDHIKPHDGDNNIQFQWVE